MNCPVCGHELQVVEERSFVQRAWAWFNDGPPVWHQRFECGACEFSGTDRSVTSLCRSTVAGGALRLWRRFQFSRRCMPVPRFHVVLAVVGAAVGISLQLTVGWPWWWTTLSMPFGGWLWAATSVRSSR